MSSPRVRRLLGIALIGAAVWFAWEFHVAAHFYKVDNQPYGGWWIAQAETERVPTTELVWGAWYLSYGLCFVACLAVGLRLTGLAAFLPRLFGRLRRERQLPVGLALVIVLLALLIRRAVILDEVLTDDENVYVYTARTLLHGRVINPLPDASGFFWNIFVATTDRGMFGKYPIGHPLVLAVGILLHLQDALLPILGGLSAWLTWKLARRVVGPSRAFLALLFLVISPQFTWTYATLLSQTTTCLALVAGTICLLQSEERGERRLLLAGAAFGYGVLARPMPGVLFVAVAALWIASESRGDLRTILRRVLLFGGPIACAMLILGVVNWRQSGNPFHSGYHEVHKGLGMLGDFQGQVGQSVVAALWRQNFWLLGWPLSLAFLPFARVQRGRLLIWGCLVAELAYRILVPKTVLDSTGPIYMMEGVPFLAILSADGLARFVLLLEKLSTRDSARTTVAAFATASTLASFALFVPVQVRALAAGARQRHKLIDAVDATGEPRGIVFVNSMVSNKELGWAYYAPSPDPDLKDDWLFLRWPPQEATANKLAIGYWKSHFADRPAFVYRPSGKPPLVPLK